MKESRKEINIQKKVGFQDKEIRMEVSHREKMGLIKEIRVKNSFGKKVGSGERNQHGNYQQRENWSVNRGNPWNYFRSGVQRRGNN